jgi:type III secretion protein L
MAYVQFAALSARPVPDAADPVLPAAEARVWQDAQALLASARRDATALLEQAQQERENERQRGYADGQAEAQMAQAETLIDNAGRMVDYFANVEQRMIGLVMGSVRRIIADYDDTERVLAVVRSGLAVMRNQKQLTLRVAPEHSDAVRSRAATLLERFPGIGILDIVADPRIKGDATIMESEIGTVEASIELQLQALENGFTKLLGNRG